MDFYKQFTLELRSESLVIIINKNIHLTNFLISIPIKPFLFDKDPRSPLGYQLQFIRFEPIGHMHESADIPNGNLIHEKFGMKNDQNCISMLNVLGDFAYPLIVERIESSEKLEKEMQNMRKMVTPEEYENVLQHLKRNSSAIKE
jgi:hypothetical protein